MRVGQVVREASAARCVPRDQAEGAKAGSKPSISLRAAEILANIFIGAIAPIKA